MLHIDIAEFQNAFEANWIDWCEGGPKHGGYTRAGRKIAVTSERLIFLRKTDILTEDVLAKNSKETERWHIEFLKHKLLMGLKFDYRDTAYYLEYLNPRYSENQAEQRANEFIDLLADIVKRGVRKPLWVADFGERKRFRYFRFDGCHRVCCAKVCDMHTVPVLLFKASEFRSV